MPNPKSVLTITGSRALSSNTTVYVAFGNGRLREDATEAKRQVTIRTPGRITEMVARVTGGNSVNGSTTVTLRKNGAATGLAITFPASGGNEIRYAPSGTYVDVVAGDLLCYEIAVSGNSGSITFGSISSCFTAVGTLGTCIDLMVNNGVAQTLSTNNQSRYCQVAGDLNISGVTEPDKGIKLFIVGGTVTNLGVYASANTRDNNTVVTLRKNSGNGNLTVTFTSGLTGWQEDTTHSDSVSSGDVLDLLFTTSSGTGSITLETTNLTFTTTNNTFPSISSFTAGQLISGNAVSYIAPGELNFSTTESFRTIPNRIRSRVYGLYTYESLNTITSGSNTFGMRQGGTTNALSVTIIGGTAGSGEISNTTNVVTLSPLDGICGQMTTANTSGSITMKSVAVISEWLPTIPPKEMGLFSGVARRRSLGYHDPF